LRIRNHGMKPKMSNPLLENPVDMEARLKELIRDLDKRKRGVLRSNLYPLIKKYAAHEIQTVLADLYHDLSIQVYHDYGESNVFEYTEKLWRTSANVAYGFSLWIQELEDRE
jgi:hypothetical protein